MAPDTGVGALIGLSGTMQIRIEAGVHHYVFEGSLPD